MTKVDREITVSQFQMERALDLAVRFVAKGIAEDAYKGTVMPAEKALDIIEHALQAVKTGWQEPQAAK